MYNLEWKERTVRTTVNERFKNSDEVASPNEMATAVAILLKGPEDPQWGDAVRLLDQSLAGTLEQQLLSAARRISQPGRDHEKDITIDELAVALGTSPEKLIRHAWGGSPQRIQ